MPLAPIRVRGKKKTATKMSSAASSSSKAAADPDGAGTEPKAPKKKARETNFSRRVSILERLPVELLVMVFMESQNMDLLFCSRRLHAALNNHYSHVRLVAQAFAPTWSAGGIRREIECYQKWERGRPCEQDCDRCCEPPPPDKGCQDIVRRQEKLIRKKLFTIDLVLDAQQIWYDTYRPKLRHIHCSPPCDPNDRCNDQCGHCKGGEKDYPNVFSVRECFEHDFRLAKASLNKEEDWSFFRSKQDVEFSVQLSPRILHGPWDENHEKLIFWLVAGGAYINHRNWDPQESYDIVRSHTNVGSHGEVSINSFFTYGALHLVSFRGWPLKEAYQFYLGNKPRLGSDEWVPECRKFNSYLQLWAGNFQVEGRYMPAIREMRRAAGRDVNDSDLPYDPDNDSGDSDWD